MSIYGKIYAAIEGGGNAYFDGKSLRDNPYDTPRLRSAWVHGWLMRRTMEAEDRTVNEKFADDFDLRLYQLLDEARAIRGEFRDQWQEVHHKLADARAIVRSMMHTDDRRPGYGS